MKLAKQILELSDLFNKNGFNGVVQVTELLNYKITTGKLKHALEALNLGQIETPLSIRTYVNWKNDKNYAECYFQCNYNKDIGIVINKLSIDINKHGIKSNFSIDLSNDKSLSKFKNSKIISIAQIQFGVPKKQKLNRKKFRI